MDDQQNGSTPSEAGSSALDRYIQKQSGGATGAIPSGAHPQEPIIRALPDLNITSSPAVAYEPAGFWRRFAALSIDLMIIGTMKALIDIPIQIAFPLLKNPPQVKPDLSNMSALLGYFGALMGVSTLITGLITFVYFGWFYKNKGASPGKMMLGLKVLDSRTGTHIGYGRTFVRDVIMRPYVSIMMTLTIGTLISVFRQDRRALHDLVAKTQVMRVKR